jgi:hypothetical protein
MTEACLDAEDVRHAVRGVLIESGPGVPAGTPRAV